MRVFGYCRVSTTEQADEGSSLASQRQQIAGYAMMKGWAVAEFFVDAAVSGSVPMADRPEGQRLLAMIELACMPRQGYTAQLHRAVSEKAGPCSLMKCRK